jgi:hypothetical protein
MKYLSWVLVAICLLALGYGLYDRGKLEGKLASLNASKQRVDSVYVRDTLTLTRVRRMDSVKVLIAAERNACNAVIETCEQRVAIRDTIITNLRSRSSFKIGLPWGIGGLAIGAAAGLLTGVVISQ